MGEFLYQAIAKAALEKRAGLVDEVRKVEADSSISDADKAAKVAAMDVDIRALEVEARGAVEAGEREAEMRDLGARLGKLGSPDPETRSGRDESDELRSIARGERAFSDFDIRAATSGTAGNAGNTKPTSFAAQVIEAMRDRSDFYRLANVITTTGGETLEFPRKTARPTAAQVAENTAYGTSDETWAKATLAAWKYGIIVQATEEIVSDSGLDILGILAADAGEAVADKVTADLLIGSGTTKPWGWITRSTGAVNAANLAGVTADNLIDLQYSLLKPYRKGAVFMMADTAVAAIRKLKGTDGQYIFQPSIVAGTPDTLLGSPLITDPNIVTSGAAAKIAVYGDPRKYMIRQVRNVRVVRSDEYGYDKDLVSFKVTWRGDGDLLDTASVKALTVTA